VTSACEAGGFSIADNESEQWVIGYRTGEILMSEEGTRAVVTEQWFEYMIEAFYQDHCGGYCRHQGCFHGRTQHYTIYD